MIDLAHGLDDCCGFWRLKSVSGKGEIVYCDLCDAKYPATQGNRHAAIEENYAGITLRRLTKEGQAHGG